MAPWEKQCVCRSEVKLGCLSLTFPSRQGLLFIAACTRPADLELPGILLSLPSIPSWDCYRCTHCVLLYVHPGELNSDAPINKAST